MKITDIPIYYNWKLNERHYGALQGLNKEQTAKKYGEKQVFLWRRSYDTPPPKLKLNDARHPQLDNKYQNLELSELPVGECLKDTVNRVISLWNEVIAPKIISGQKILIVAHGNSLRALVKFLDKKSDKEIVNLNIPTGIPLIYELNQHLQAINHNYLGDQETINKKIKSIIIQGNVKNN